MNFDPNKQEVYDFLQDPAHMHGVLGYLDAVGNPDSAFVGFSVMPNLDIIFGTSNDSRKFSCILANKHVSFNVSDEAKRQTIQLKGIVEMIPKPDFDQYENAHYAKIGESFRKFKDAPDREFFIIRPTWLRFSDCSGFPWALSVLIDK